MGGVSGKATIKSTAGKHILFNCLWILTSVFLTLSQQPPMGCYPLNSRSRLVTGHLHARFIGLKVFSSQMQPSLANIPSTWWWHDKMKPQLLSFPPRYHPGKVTSSGCLDPRPDMGYPGKADGHREGRANGQRSGGWGGNGNLTAVGPGGAGHQ